MKQLVLVMAVTLLAAACNTAKKEEPKSDESKSTTGSFPATYSSSFEMGDMKLAEKAVQHSWKDWESNNFDGLSDFFADTVTAFMSDGSTIIGPKDSLIAMWKKVRAGLTTVVDSINAYTPVYSTDKKENWALLWVTDYSTDAKGKKDTVDYMETWRFNKDGKADLVLQYQRIQPKK